MSSGKAAVTKIANRKRAVTNTLSYQGVKTLSQSADHGHRSSGTAKLNLFDAVREEKVNSIHCAERRDMDVFFVDAARDQLVAVCGL